MSESVSKEIVQIIAKQLVRPEKDILPDARLVEDLGADSLDVVELMLNLEAALETKVDEKEAMKLRTVADVVAYVQTCRQPAQVG
jgi:acyl carrier protein